MITPEVVMTDAGPSVLHADFSPVTQARPSRAGEVLIAIARGLGPARNHVPGQPLPADPLAIVNSPVEVVVNGTAVPATNQVGMPGTTDTYRVDFRVPDAVTGDVRLQIRAAWIDSAAVTIPVR
jgi:uncharacterized protein (TIGR03437 family)